MDFMIWNVPGIVATELLMGLWKKLWPEFIKDRVAVAASVLTGEALAWASWFSGLLPEANMLTVVGMGLFAGLGACGLYSGVKSR